MGVIVRLKQITSSMYTALQTWTREAHDARTSWRSACFLMRACELCFAPAALAGSVLQLKPAETALTPRALGPGGDLPMLNALAPQLAGAPLETEL